MNKSVNHSFRMGIVYLIVLGSVACQTKKTGKPTTKNVAHLRCEHGSVAASNVFKTQPHINVGAG